MSKGVKSAFHSISSFLTALLTWGEGARRMVEAEAGVSSDYVRQVEFTRGRGDSMNYLVLPRQSQSLGLTMLLILQRL